MLGNTVTLALGMAEPAVGEDDFEGLYARAGDDLDAVPWALLASHPALVAWLDERPAFERRGGTRSGLRLRRRRRGAGSTRLQGDGLRHLSQRDREGARCHLISVKRREDAASSGPITVLGHRVGGTVINAQDQTADGACSG